MINEEKREVSLAEVARLHREHQAEREAVNWLLAHMADDLPPESATYKAVARQAPWRVVLQMAQWEGFFEVVNLLEEVAENLGTDALEQKSGIRKLDS